VNAIDLRRRMLILAPLALAACATPMATLVAPERRIVGGAFSVEPGVRWNRLERSPFGADVEVWTQDGLGLDMLMFVAGARDGTPIFALAAARSPTSAEAAPVFHSTMTPVQIMELFGTSIARTFGTNAVQTSALRRVNFAGEPGFSFETAWTGRDQIDRVGRAVGTVRDGRLYLIWFEGTKLHHFRRYEADFDRLVASTRLVGTKS
jgi:hypothetical protein